MKHSCLSLVFISVTALAQTPGAEIATPPIPSLPAVVPLQVAPRIGINSEADLSLSQVISAVLANNLDILVSKLTHEKARLNLTAAKGYFDPVFAGNAYALRQVTPVASSLGGGVNGETTQKEIYADPQISGNSRWLGTTYKLDFASARIDNNNTFNTLNPTFPASATLNLTQPLWGGLLFDQNRERLSVAKKNVMQTEEQFKQRVIEVTTQAIHAYWELDYARRNVEVQIDAVRLAESQDASNRRQVAQGTEAPIDVIQTQTQLSTYQQNVLSAQQQLTQAENKLKTLMLPDRGDILWDAAIHTVTGAPESSSIPTLEAAVHQALAQRPDVKAGLAGVQVSALEARLAKEQARPQVNLTAQLSAQGLSGRTVTQTSDLFGTLFTPLFSRLNELSTLAGLPPLDTSGLTSASSVPAFFVGGYGQSLSNIGDVRFPTVQVGIQVSLPIGNRTARAEASSAELTRRQSVTQQQQLEMTVESDVRNSLQQLVDSDMVLKESHRAVQLAQEQYDSEQRQFKAGTSTVFLVLQRQSELTNAKLREIRAIADRGEAEADFDQATGNTLDRQHIDIVGQVKQMP